MIDYLCVRFVHISSSPNVLSQDESLHPDNIRAPSPTPTPKQDLTDTYASIATEAAEAQGRPTHTSIAGMLVWKASCPHYNVHVQSGALANALASTFGLDLSEGDAVASAELREGSRWQRENAMGIDGAIDPDELALLIAEARKVSVYVLTGELGAGRCCFLRFPAETCMHLSCLSPRPPLLEVAKGTPHNVV